MRASAVSFIHKLTAAALAASLTLSLAPTAYAEGESSSDDNSGVVAPALADQPNDSTDSSLGESQGVSAEQDTEDSPVAPMPASGLAGKPGSFINSDVALDSEPIIGSFTVDGLTYAVIDGPYVELVGVSPDWQQVTNSQEGKGFGAAPMLASGSDGAETDASTLALPEAVTYSGVNYTLASIAPYAFYLSGVTDLTLPASVSDVDDRAFRSSDVASVTVAEGNPTYSFFDGALYDAEQLSLLLIPEGKQGAVLLPKTTEVAEASVFSHCPLVDSISVEKDGAAFASENGLLYDSDLTTLLRVPTGAIEITIRDGCTTIATGALEACAKLTTINAPATVTSISPDVFRAIPTVSLPAASVILSEGAKGPGVEESDESQTSEAAGQLTAMVALFSADANMPEVTPSSIRVLLPAGAAALPYEAMGFPCSRISASQDSPTHQEPASSAIGETSSSYSTRLSLGLGSFDGYYLVEGLWKPSSWPGPFQFAVGDKIPLYAGGTDQSGVRLTLEADGGCSWRNCNTPYVFDGANIVMSAQHNAGLRFKGWALDPAATVPYKEDMPFDFVIWDTSASKNATFYPIWHEERTVVFDPNGGAWDEEVAPKSIAQRILDESVALPSVPTKEGFRCLGWYDESGTKIFDASSSPVTNMEIDAPLEVSLHAEWTRTDYDLGFDVDSEPGDADCEGEPKDDQTVNVEDGPTVIEDPKRPGYVFQGWTIPNAEGTEAIDQDLVYQDETDGKWYVDASKLPDYAGEDGRVELTARWSAAVKVDAPLSATFYYDLTLPDGEGYWDEARDAAVEGAAGAAGTAAIRNHSAVPLRVAGMESATGKDSARLLKKGDEWVNDLPKGEASVLSVFPTKSASTGTEDAALGPSSASQGKGDDLAHAVTLALDEVKLEAAFDADAWAIGAATVGDNGIVSKTGDLRLGYRLDLGGEGGITLDYDALLGATEGDEGKAAPLTSIAYCFALQAPRPTGTRSDPLYVEVTDPEVGGVGVYGLADIKAAADDFSSRVDPATDPNDWASISSQIAGSPYAKLYTELYKGGALFYAKTTTKGYVAMQIIGICQDIKADGTKAGFTFQTRDCVDSLMPMNSSYTNAGVNGWIYQPLRSYIRSLFDSALVSNGIATVTKYHQVARATNYASPSALQGPTQETVFLPNVYEVSKTTRNNTTAQYGYHINPAEEHIPSAHKFQYQFFSDHGLMNKKDKGGTLRWWWLRSSFCSNGRHFESMCCAATSRVDFCSTAYTGEGAGVAPCFAL